MSLWQGFNSDGVVFKDYRVLACIYAMEEYGIFDFFAKEVQLWAHGLFKHGVGIDVKWCSSSQQAKGGYEPN